MTTKILVVLRPGPCSVSFKINLVPYTYMQNIYWSPISETKKLVHKQKTGRFYFEHGNV